MATALPCVVASSISPRRRSTSRGVTYLRAQQDQQHGQSQQRVRWQKIELERVWGPEDPVVQQQGHTVTDTWAAVPDQQTPRGVVHLVGGALFGAMCRDSYGLLAERIARSGFVVATTPYALTTKHFTAASEARKRLLAALEQTGFKEAVYSNRMPLVGVGHSLGTVLLVLITCNAEGLIEGPIPQYNVLMSFNNQNVNDPLVRTVRIMEENFFEPLVSALLKPLRLVFGTKSAPSRDFWLASAQIEKVLTEQAALSQPGWPYLRNLISRSYICKSTLLLRFEGDHIDESPILKDLITTSNSEQSELQLGEKEDAEHNNNVQLMTVNKVNEAYPHLTPMQWQQTYEPDNPLLRWWQSFSSKAAINTANMVTSWLGIKVT